MSKYHLFPVINKHGNIAMCGNILSILESVKDYSDSDKVLLVTVQVTLE